MKVQKRRLSEDNSAHHHRHGDVVESLNAFLLKPRSLPLPWYLSPRHYSFTEIFGHAFFILVAASYATDDFVHLRIMAVMGARSMVFFSYSHPHGRVLWLPLKWNALFIAINSYRILTVMWNRYQAEHFLQPELQKFREDHLAVVEPVDWYRLMSVGIGTIEEFTKGDLGVRRDGVLTYVVEEGNFMRGGIARWVDVGEYHRELLVLWLGNDFIANEKDSRDFVWPDISRQSHDKLTTSRQNCTALLTTGKKTHDDFHPPSEDAVLT